MQEALLQAPGAGKLNTSQQVAGALQLQADADDVPTTGIHRSALEWDPLSDVSWPKAQEVNWEREIVLELRRLTAHMQNL